MSNDYVTSDEFRDAVMDPSTLEQGAIDSAIAAASRKVDALCARRFYKDAEASARVYRLCDWFKASVDDFYTTTDLVVETDLNPGAATASWHTLTLDSDFYLEPLNGIRNGLEGWPYNTLRATQSRMTFQPSYGRPSLRVTAMWGWAAIPAEVKRATISFAALEYRQPGGAPFGVAGFGGDGVALKVQPNQNAYDLLRPYKSERTVLVA
jgi:hypothetical protein